MKKIKAFTLLELIIVIAIISLFLLIAIPSITKFKTSASEKTDKLNVNILVEATTMYCVDNSWEDKEIKVDGNDVLTQGGYITNIPKSPITNNFYTVKVKDNKITVTSEWFLVYYITLIGYSCLCMIYLKKKYI